MNRSFQKGAFCLLLLLFFSSRGFCEEYFEKYVVSYGSPDAPIVVRQYVSFDCGVCHDFYKKVFPKIKAKYLDKNKLRWDFVPYPLDLSTIRAMICLEKFNRAQKRSFFELTFPFAFEQSENLLSMAMQKISYSFGTRPGEIDSNVFLRNSQTMTDAFHFRKEVDFTFLPAFDIQGQVIEGNLSLDELFSMIDKRIKERFS